MTDSTPQPTRILLVRHGQTDWNQEQRIQGQTDIALNQEGESQARLLAQSLASEPLDAIYASDLGRARATALAVAQRQGRDLRVDGALRERNYGCFEGLRFADIESQWPDLASAWRRRDPHFAPPAAETLLQLRERVIPAVHRIAARHAGEHIMLVTHGGVIDVVYREAAGMDLTQHRTWDLSNTALNRLLWSEQRLAIVAWGDTAHLDSPHADAAYGLSKSALS